VIEQTEKVGLLTQAFSTEEQHRTETEKQRQSEAKKAVFLALAFEEGTSQSPVHTAAQR
jgi:hypothetical protein